jgi:hypothetical protein
MDCRFCGGTGKFDVSGLKLETLIDEGETL